MFATNLPVDPLLPGQDAVKVNPILGNDVAVGGIGVGGIVVGVGVGGIDVLVGVGVGSIGVEVGVGGIGVDVGVGVGQA